MKTKLNINSLIPKKTIKTENNTNKIKSKQTKKNNNYVSKLNLDSIRNKLYTFSAGNIKLEEVNNKLKEILDKVISNSKTESFINLKQLNQSKDNLFASFSFLGKLNNKSKAINK